MINCELVVIACKGENVLTRQDCRIHTTPEFVQVTTGLEHVLVPWHMVDAIHIQEKDAQDE